MLTTTRDIWRSFASLYGGDHTGSVQPQGVGSFAELIAIRATMVLTKSASTAARTFVSAVPLAAGTALLWKAVAVGSLV